MSLEITAADSLDSAITTIADFFYDDLTSASPLSVVDRATLAMLGFKGKPGETVRVAMDGKLIIAVGLGSKEEANASVFRRAAGNAVRILKQTTNAAAVLAPTQSQAVGVGLVLGSYVFSAHKSEPAEVRLQSIEVVGAHTGELDAGVTIATATNVARDMINEPPSHMTPRAVARVANETAAHNGLVIDIWDHEKIIDEQLGGILGVSRGSDEPPRMVKLTYEPANANAETKTIALCGKGITFDSGGLSLKPADSMIEMKTDMAGAAAVLAAMSTLPFFKPNVRVIGFLVVSENLPGPSATKPGDVLVARNGKTMEVLNTDAEGRLVLADALSLAAEEMPNLIIDIATLTAAAKMALGNDIAGVFSTDDSLLERLQESSANTGENIWRLPLHEKYAKLVESNVADVKNQASPGGGGLITSAHFLKAFVEDVPWVHIDIAGTARGDGDDALNVKGGTGYGVRLLVDLLRNYA